MGGYPCQTAGPWMGPRHTRTYVEKLIQNVDFVRFSFLETDYHSLMFWESKDLRKEMRIRERIAKHEQELVNEREKLRKLYDSVYRKNKRNGTVST